ncbi:XRE family transcriptional regulator [Streptomyces sp. NPDC046939]|uniref:XRE family transcriptional regulator n=1 Tax=Streptomyces sp. NPDC046939 TaxID=3155376 RepID=UPI0033F806C8
MDDLTRGGAYEVVDGPGEARTVREFVALLRRRKEASGLTYRQLELRAARNGDVLARSTLAGALSREALPKADLLSAFVRACGVSEEEAAEWEAARARLATNGADTDAGARPEAGVGGAGLHGDPDGADGGGVPVRAEGAGGSLRRGGKRLVRARRRGPLLLVGAVLAAALVVTAVLASRDDDTTGKAGVPVGAVTVRPLEGPDLCLTDGMDRQERYDSLIAVFRPCAEASPPVTELRATADGRHRVRWYHPDHGAGCLVAREDGPPKGFLEPFDNCREGSPLRLKHVRGTSSTYVLEVTGARCVTAGARGERPVDGIEAVVRACDGSAGQRFVIRRISTGTATSTAG